MSITVNNFKLITSLPVQINIAALRIAADKFDPDFIDKRKVALEVRYNMSNNLLLCIHECVVSVLLERFCW